MIHLPPQHREEERATLLADIGWHDHVTEIRRTLEKGRDWQQRKPRLPHY